MDGTTNNMIVGMVMIISIRSTMGVRRRVGMIIIIGMTTSDDNYNNHIIMNKIWENNRSKNKIGDYNMHKNHNRTKNINSNTNMDK